MEGKVRLNFDGFSFENPGPTGYGCVARDSHGEVLFALCGSLGICR